MQGHNELSQRRKPVISVDKKIAAIRLVFAIYAYVCGQALYKNYSLLSTSTSHHYVAVSAEVWKLSPKELSEIDI